ncbi:MAG: hypothetical protein CW342_03110 [Thermoactinomycetaceae bacterium]|nr:hypothetical protein [Bacillota bacterium]MBO2531879.1 hypothetical protein [Thermoactinomycetaceae bacterium]
MPGTGLAKLRSSRALGRFFHLTCRSCPFTVFGRKGGLFAGLLSLGIGKRFFAERLPPHGAGAKIALSRSKVKEA